MAGGNFLRQLPTVFLPRKQTFVNIKSLESDLTSILNHFLYEISKR